jgi:ubiquitin-protein ligase
MFRRLEKEKTRTKNIVNWDKFTFTYKNQEIKININDVYPFKPPKLLIEEKDHIDWFLKKYMEFNFLKKFGIKNDCICCHTIICKWVPTFTIDQVLDEYKLYYDKYELIKKIHILFKQQFFDDLVYEKIFLYLVI